MKLLIIILLLSILFLTGCEQQPITGATTKEIPREIICSPPYIRHAENCCLDQNSNNICDKDETQETEIPKPQPQTTIEDSCSPTTYFDCWGSYITQNEIFLKLKAKRDGYSIVKKIEFPSINCEKKLELIQKEQGLEIRESIEIKIPCMTSTTYFKDLPYNLELIYYPSSGDTTEWLNKTRGIIINYGTITGTVRSQPPKII